jgi:hypothetical protein
MKLKNFRLSTPPVPEETKWWEFRRMGKKEYGYNAILCLLLGFILKGVVGDTIALVGLISGIIWVIKVIKDKIRK